MTETASTTITREQSIQKSYNIAQKQLREKYLTEFNEMRIAAVKADGFDWSPEPTPAEKALEVVKGLLNDYPDITADVISLISDQTQGQIAALAGLTAQSADQESAEARAEEPPEDDEAPLEFSTSDQQ